MHIYVYEKFKLLFFRNLAGILAGILDENFGGNHGCAGEHEFDCDLF